MRNIQKRSGIETWPSCSSEMCIEQINWGHITHVTNNIEKAQDQFKWQAFHGDEVEERG